MQNNNMQINIKLSSRSKRNYIKDVYNTALLTLSILQNSNACAP